MAEIEEATFGAGCFWHVEDLFMATPGIISTEVGFMGGKMKNPTYKNVCYDGTGHAEVVHLKFDPAKISYEQLLRLFWENHNPTTMNRQGPDVGTQYRSAVFYYSAEQKKIAEKSKQEQEKSGKWVGKKIVTEIVPAQEFYRAEEYHQKYLMKNGLSSCNM